MFVKYAPKPNVVSGARVMSMTEVHKFWREVGFDTEKLSQKEISGFMKLCNDVTLSKLG